MSTVRTQAGRTFVEAADTLGYGAYDAARFAGLGEEFEDAVAAIEAEARAAAFGEVDEALGAALYDNPRLMSDGDELFDEIIRTLDAVLTELREEAP